MAAVRRLFPPRRFLQPGNLGLTRFSPQPTGGGLGFGQPGLMLAPVALGLVQIGLEQGRSLFRLVEFILQPARFSLGLRVLSGLGGRQGYTLWAITVGQGMMSAVSKHPQSNLKNSLPWQRNPEAVA